MTTINELLNQIGVTNESTEEKTANDSSVPFSEKDMNNVEEELGFKNEKKEFFSTKTASQGNGGQDMNYGLHTLYNEYFSDESEKTASDQTENTEFEKEAAATEEAIGEFSRFVFDSLMDQHLEKIALDQVMDSEATQARNQTTGVIPGAAVAQPQLEVNRPADATKAIDTTPKTTDLLDAAVKKEMILRKLEEGKPGELSHKTMSVDMGLETPTDQKDA